MRTSSCVVALGLGLVVSSAWAAEGEATGEKGAGEKMDAAAMEKMMIELGTPGPEHEEFEEMVGRWKAEVKDYFSNPDEPVESQGTATFTLVLGGRFLKQEFRGECYGKPFEGMGLCGYCKAKKKYVSIWLDSTWTGILVMEGDYDDETDTLVETGEAESPKGKMKIKHVVKELDDDHVLMTMYMLLPEGKETKTMEIRYTREK